MTVVPCVHYCCAQVCGDLVGGGKERQSRHDVKLNPKWGQSTRAKNIVKEMAWSKNRATKSNYACNFEIDLDYPFLFFFYHPVKSGHGERHARCRGEFVLVW